MSKTAGTRRRNLDALRAVGALAVLGMHANALISVAHPAPVDALTLVRFGLWSGVNLFFVLSGYLITLPFVQALVDGTPLPGTRTYLLRRAARILPAYWLALVALELVSRPATGGAASLSHVLLLQDLVPGQTRTVFPIAWSLGIEAMFYVAVPLAAAAVRARCRGPVAPRALLLGVGAAWLLSSAYSAAVHAALGTAAPRWQDFAQVSLPGTLFLFCPGIAAAVAEAAIRHNDGTLRTYRGAIRRAPVLALVAAVGWVLQALLIDTSTLAGRVLQDQSLTLVCGLALLAALHAGPRLSRAAALLAPVGVVSYGVYLWHWVLAVAWVTWIGHLHHATGSGHLAWLAATLVLAGTSVALGTLSWRLVERPAQRAAARAAAATRLPLAVQQRQPHRPPRVVAVEVDEHHALPGAQPHPAVLHRDHHRG